MSEKKGNTVKIVYDFESWKCLEIYVDSIDKWHRVIPKEFRAYSGKRRITTWDKDNNPIHDEYNGPVYYYMTNTICKEPEGKKIQHLISPTPMEKREWETFDVESLAPGE